MLLFKYLSCSGSTSKQGKKKKKPKNIKTKAQEMKEKEKNKGREDDTHIAKNRLELCAGDRAAFPSFTPSPAPDPHHLCQGGEGECTRSLQSYFIGNRLCNRCQG